MTPYIEKAVRLRLKIASKLPEDSLLESTLNSFSLPVAILNEFGEVIAQNNLLKELTLESDHIVINQGVIKIQDENVDFNFQLSIANAISSAKNKSLEYAPKPISISNNSATFKLGVCELVEKSNKSAIFLGAMMYLIPETIDKSVNLEHLISTFGVTKKEANICSLIINNHSSMKIAEIENRSVHTIREQLKNCYCKFGVKNQLELINLVGSLPTK